MPTSQTFHDFYPAYLAQHRDRNCRRMHLLGSILALLLIVYAVASGQWPWLLLAPLAGYGCAWIGHYCFEHNRPTAFGHPVYSFLGDWLMVWQMLTGKIRF